MGTEADDPVGYVLGRLCKVLLPIPEDIVYGNAESRIVICTLSSIGLIRDLSDILLNDVALIGRLLSENAGIDAMLQHLHENPRLDTMILCGREVAGHRAGDSLLMLYRNGVDEAGRIRGSNSPSPVLKSPASHVERFQSMRLIVMIGETDPARIRRAVPSIR